MKQTLLYLFIVFGIAKVHDSMAQMRAVANVKFNMFAGTALKTSTINNNDTVVFDLSQATCVGQYFLVPVSIISDDVINAVDFSMKYNNTKITYNSVVNYKPAYLTPSANFNTTDSTLRFTSFSFTQPIEHNVAVAAVKFNLLAGPVLAANFNTVKSYLNGDKCAFKFIGAVMPTATISASGPTTFISGDSVSLTANAGAGFTYLWSTASTKQTIKVFTAATYMVTVTNIGGCTANTAATVFVGTPLPIQLINFNLIAINAGIEINWTTATEINNDFFTIEHSVNGNDWKVLARIYSKGNANSITNYSFLDSNPVQGINYYRLNQTDLNGSTTFLSIQKIKYGFENKNDLVISVFPNPANSFITIRTTENGTVQLYNLNGIEIGKPLQLATKKENRLNINLLPNGIYYLKVISNNNYKTEKIVIEN